MEGMREGWSEKGDPFLYWNVENPWTVRMARYIAKDVTGEF